MRASNRVLFLIGSIASLMLGATAGCAVHHAQRDLAGTPPAIVEITKTDHPTVFVGEGRLSAAPEYIELGLAIESECYATPMAATAAADDAAKRVLSTLRRTLDPANSRDGVFSNGGYTRSFERRVSSTFTTCRGTYAKTIELVVKTSRIADFQAGFSELQHELLASSLQQPAKASRDRALTYAVLSVPQPRLYYETRETLEQRALGDALQNARRKLEATVVAGCGESDYDILRMVETSPNAARPIAYARSQLMTGGDAIELDAIWINKLLEVSFMIEPGRCTHPSTRRPRDRAPDHSDTRQ